MTAFHTKDISGKRFLVTGGAGFIGGHIVEYLLLHGAALVRVLDNLATGSSGTVDLFKDHPRYEFINGDIRDAEVCRSACARIDHVSHQAALGSVPRSVSDPITSNNVNLGGFVNMLTAAKDAGIQTFVYASSSSVYGDDPQLPKKEDRIGSPLSPYAVTKRANELYADVFGKLYGMKLVGLRYFNVFGPRQDPNGPYAAVIPLFISGVLHSTPVYMNGDGEQTRDFTYVANAVQANIRGMLTDNDTAFGQVYNVAVGANFSINEVFRAICRLTGKEHAPLYREARVGDVHDSLADISKVSAMLGYEPTVQFLDGLKATVDHFTGK